MITQASGQLNVSTGMNSNKENTIKPTIILLNIVTRKFNSTIPYLIPYYFKTLLL